MPLLHLSSYDNSAMESGNLNNVSGTALPAANTNSPRRLYPAQLVLSPSRCNQENDSDDGQFFKSSEQLVRINPPTPASPSSSAFLSKYFDYYSTFNPEHGQGHHPHPHRVPSHQSFHVLGGTGGCYVQPKSENGEYLDHHHLQNAQAALLSQDEARSGVSSTNTAFLSACVSVPLDCGTHNACSSGTSTSMSVMSCEMKDDDEGDGNSHGKLSTTVKMEGEDEVLSLDGNLDNEAVLADNENTPCSPIVCRGRNKKNGKKYRSNNAPRSAGIKKPKKRKNQRGGPSRNTENKMRGERERRKHDQSYQDLQHQV